MDSMKLAPFVLSLCALASAQGGPRCATPSLAPAVLAALQNGSIPSGFQTRLAAGRLAASPTPRTASSEHFTVVWMPSGSASRDTLPAAMSAIPAGDSLPEAVRLCLTTLEQARRLIVDTLGMHAPRPAAASWHWGIAPTGHRYVVELVKVDAGNFPNTGLSSSLTYFALTLPRGDSGSTNLAITPNWTRGGLPGWSFVPDTATTGKALSHNYATDWREGLAATTAHELMHTAQFRYESPTDEALHFFFEAGAVGFEERAVPWTLDWLLYASYLYSNDLQLDAIDPWYVPYAQGIFVQSLYQDCGDAFQPTFWNDRASRGGDALATLQRSSSVCLGDLPGVLARHSLRLMGSGTRSSWLPQTLDTAPLKPLRMALAMPSLKHAALRDTGAISGQFLSNPALTPTFRTVGASDRRLAVVLGTPTRRLLTGLGPDFLGQDDDFLLLPPSAQARWIGLVNPSRDTARSWLGSGVAPDSVVLAKGDNRTWPLSQVRLSGTSRDSATVRAWQCRDCWKPAATDAFYASADSAHVYRLYDFERSLRLQGATLSFPISTVGAKLYRLSGSGWNQLPSSTAARTLTATLDTLDLRRPATFLVTAGTSATLTAQVEAPYPNPARAAHAAIRFPLRVWSDKAHLTLHAADGTLVASLRPAEGASEVVWNLRTRGGQRVAPGLYFYRWEAATGAVEGRLLVGH